MQSQLTGMIALATRHVSDILSMAVMHASTEPALIVADKQCELAQILSEAYRICLPNAKFIDFDAVTQAQVMAAIDELVATNLVVLIQSTSFRLEAYRIRIELFARSLKVIEHPHLSRMSELEQQYYINSLAYDADYFRHTGKALKNLIDHAKEGVIDSGGEYLVFSSEFESAKLNIGDYSEMNNIGGQFPIGEVFTEAKDLECVNGRVRVFAFGDTTFTVNKPEKPLTLVISKGRVIDVIDSTAEFNTVLDNIRADEGEVMVRELGFGLNRAFSKNRTVCDIGTYERMCGIHLSLGAKHGAYKRNQFKKARHHVDIFAVTEQVFLDDKLVYSQESWQV